MSRRGNGHDNAVAESFFNLLKRERIRRKVYRTRDEARRDVFDYIEMFYTPPGSTDGTECCHPSSSNGSTKRKPRASRKLGAVQTEHGSHPGTVAEVWAEEVRHLMAMPRPFDGLVEHAKRVPPTCLVHIRRNRYSVPASFANRPVTLRVYPDRIVVVAEWQAVCEHLRVFARPHG